MKNKKILAVLAAASMLIGLMAPMSVMADTATQFQYTPVSGTSTSFNKYLVIPAGTNIPNVTFGYTIAAGTARSADTHSNAVMDVIPGPDVDKITISNTTFAPTDATAASAGTNIDVARTASERASGATAETGVEFETAKGEVYATKTATIDFSQVAFPEPGIYRYIVTETASAADEAAGIHHDDDVDRVLDVYVTDDGNGTLVVSAYVLHTEDEDVVISADMGAADVAAAGAALSDKTDGFTNEYKPADLVCKKEVSGNGASRDKYFAFTLKLANLTPNDKFTVSIADDNDANTTDGNADATSGSNQATIDSYEGKANVQELTAGADGTVEQVFYLQHGQSFAVRGLPRNATYELTEDAENYKSTAAAVTDHTDPVKTEGNATLGSVAGDDSVAKTSYLNSITSILPTGISSEAFVMGISVIAFAAAGIVVIAMLRKHRA